MPFGHVAKRNERPKTVPAAPALSAGGAVIHRPPVWRDAFEVIDEGINAESVHVWKFDPVVPMAVQWHTLGTERTIRLNRHDYFEIFVVRAGELTGRVQDRLVTLRTGDIFLMGSTHYHALSAPRGTARIVGLIFLRELVCRDWTDDKTELLKPFLLEESGGPSVIRSQPRLAKELVRLMTLIGQAGPSDSVRKRVLARTRLEMILVHLVEHLGSTLDNVSLQQGLSQIERLRPVFDRVERDLTERISIEQAAALVGMSRTSFVRWFRRVMGQTFSAYIVRLRIARAQHLLITTDWTVAAVAQHLGFSEQSYFCRVFRRLAGSTPRAYRHRHAPSTSAP
jgi:AraC-like DNA-binding protein